VPRKRNEIDEALNESADPEQPPDFIHPIEKWEEEVAADYFYPESYQDE
jgi:hypothetical protein